MENEQSNLKKRDTTEMKAVLFIAADKIPFKSSQRYKTYLCWSLIVRIRERQRRTRCI